MNNDLLSILEKFEATVGKRTSRAAKALPVLCYLFKVINHSEFKTQLALEGLTKDQIKVLSRAVVWNAKVNLELKITAFAYVSDGLKFLTEKGSPNDRKLIKEILQLNTNLSGRLLKKLKDAEKEYHAYSIKEVLAIEEKVLAGSDVTQYTMKFIQKKMKFIIQSFKLDPLDIKYELYSRALFIMRLNYPCWNNSGELKAMSKSGIKSSGHNLITHYAATKRAKMDRDNVTVENSLDAFANTEKYQFKSLIFTDNTVIDRLEAKMSVDSLIASTKLSEGQKYVVKLLTGKERCEEFSTYLGGCNVEYAEAERFDCILAKVSSFVGVEKSQVLGFLERLR